MKFTVIPDALWFRIAPLLPRPPHRDPRRGGRPRVPDRSALNGILYVLNTGVQWQQLPKELGYGSGSTCWRRLRDWDTAGVWDAVQQHLLIDLDRQQHLNVSDLLVDGSKVRAKKGATEPGTIPLTAGDSGSNDTC